MRNQKNEIENRKMLKARETRKKKTVSHEKFMIWKKLTCNDKTKYRPLGHPYQYLQPKM